MPLHYEHTIYNHSTGETSQGPSLTLEELNDRKSDPSAPKLLNMSRYWECTAYNSATDSSYTHRYTPKITRYTPKLT